ncbi:uncharacterized protein LOC110454188 [Mizuhopecten yessoensis]|uniref:Uncharacterized protein n=1 Tax=Mizuhopecten yessoensis TaxID=6573 RepID=A0A210QFQ0_MIZYE|nr:uncharacterized protein LOC110454188 [Mizuhopecten yessoensis]OWF47572.1 hypothetical protein KP79_PYT06775 [Mizuhopecten yessoensis]
MNVKRPKRTNKKRELQLPSVFLNNSWNSNEDPEEPAELGYKRLLPVKLPNGSSKLSPRQLSDKTQLWSNGKSGKSRFQKGTHKYGNISETGIYNESVDKFYKLVTRENSIMLPPLQTSSRVKFNISNYIDMAEKKYVMRDFQTEGKMSKFARDEVYIPSLNKEMFTCYECRRRYVSDMYTEAFATRNSKKPKCVAMATRNNKKNSSIRGRGTRAQFCDVLGKRFCSECGESENRKMRQAILNTYPTGHENGMESDSPSHMQQRRSFHRKRVIINPIPTLVTYDES